MNHDKFRDMLSGRRERAVEPGEARDLARHLEQCPECARESAGLALLARAAALRAPTAAQTERCVARVMARLDAPRPSLWERWLAVEWLTPALGLATAALALSFLPYASDLAAYEPVFVAQGREVALSPARRVPPPGVSEVIGLADSSR